MDPLFPGGGWIDLSDRAKFRLSGSDRERFLQGQVSNDVRHVRADAAIYACVMTVKGKMSADIFIRGEADAYFIDADATLREPLAARLERYIIADDVTLEDITEAITLAHVVAPRSLPPLPPELSSSFGSAHASRYGREGIDVFGPREMLDHLRAWLGGGELSAPEAELLRISEGVPRWGLDLAEDTIPVEAGLEARAISYTKGCYIGQEVISRIKSVGHVNHHLRRLRAGFNLRAGDRLERDGKTVGEITSAAAIPGTGGWLALGYLRHGSENVGMHLRHPSGEVEVW